MKEAYRTFQADGADPGALWMDRPVTDAMKSDLSGVEWHNDMRRQYHEEAVCVVDFMQRHMPQGLVDHIMAELCLRKANLFITAEKQGD